MLFKPEPFNLTSWPEWRTLIFNFHDYFFIPLKKKTAKKRKKKRLIDRKWYFYEDVFSKVKYRQICRTALSVRSYNIIAQSLCSSPLKWNIPGAIHSCVKLGKGRSLFFLASFIFKVISTMPEEASALRPSLTYRLTLNNNPTRGNILSDGYQFFDMKK